MSAYNIDMKKERTNKIEEMIETVPLFITNFQLSTMGIKKMHMILSEIYYFNIIEKRIVARIADIFENEVRSIENNSYYASLFLFFRILSSKITQLSSDLTTRISRLERCYKSRFNCDNLKQLSENVSPFQIYDYLKGCGIEFIQEWTQDNTSFTFNYSITLLTQILDNRNHSCSFCGLMYSFMINYPDERKTFIGIFENLMRNMITTKQLKSFLSMVLMVTNKNDYDMHYFTYEQLDYIEEIIIECARKIMEEKERQTSSSIFTENEISQMKLRAPMKMKKFIICEWKRFMEYIQQQRNTQFQIYASHGLIEIEFAKLVKQEKEENERHQTLPPDPYASSNDNFNQNYRYTYFNNTYNQNYRNNNYNSNSSYQNFNSNYSNSNNYNQNYNSNYSKYQYKQNNENFNTNNNTMNHMNIQQQSFYNERKQTSPERYQRKQPYNENQQKKEQQDYRSERQYYKRDKSYDRKRSYDDSNYSYYSYDSYSEKYQNHRESEKYHNRYNNSYNRNNYHRRNISYASSEDGEYNHSPNYQQSFQRQNDYKSKQSSFERTPQKIERHRSNSRNKDEQKIVKYLPDEMNISKNESKGMYNEDGMMKVPSVENSKEKEPIVMKSTHTDDENKIHLGKELMQMEQQKSEHSSTSNDEIDILSTTKRDTYCSLIIPQEKDELVYIQIAKTISSLKSYTFDSLSRELLLEFPNNLCLKKFIEHEEIRQIECKTL